MAIRLRNVVKFPARVIAEKGVGLELINGTYRFALDYSGLTLSDEPPGSAVVAYIDPDTGLLGSAKLTDILNFSDNLTSISEADTAADQVGYWTGSGSYGLADFTPFARTLVDDADASTARTTLGVAIGSNVQAYSVNLDGFSSKTAPTGTVVGANDTQTLTNKTISGANNSLTVRIADISATGTPTSSKALFGDGTWKVPAGEGDMLRDTYDPNNLGVDAFDSSNTGFIQGGVDPIPLSVQEELRRHAVRPDQFRLSSDSDDSASFLRARDRAMAQGLPIGVRGGSYTISETVEIDVSAQTDFTGHGRYSLIGDGPGITEITWAGASTDSAIRLTGGTTGASMEQYGLIKGIKLVAATAGEAAAIEINIGAVIHFEDILAFNFSHGFKCYDALSSTFTNVTARWCKYGLAAVYNSFSRPNALTLLSCRFGHNSECGVYIEGGSQFNMIGGSVEGNGIDGSDTVRGGVRIFSPGVEGGVAANFEGVYFEANDGAADIYLTAGPNPSITNVRGCNFNRVADVYCTNNIYVEADTAGDTILNVEGSSFRGFGAYTPSSSRPYIKTNVSSTNFVLNADPITNYFASDTEAPRDFVGKMVASARPIAKCRFNGTLSSPAVVNGYNVASITKNGTGDYTVTLQRGTGLTGKTAHVVTNDFASSVQLVGESTNSCRFFLFNAGIATDASNVCVTIFDG